MEAEIINHLSAIRGLLGMIILCLAVIIFVITRK